MNIIELLEKDFVIARAQEEFENAINYVIKHSDNCKNLNAYSFESMATQGAFYTKSITNRLDFLFSKCNAPVDEANYIGFQFYWDEQKHVGVSRKTKAINTVSQVSFDKDGHSGIGWADRLYEIITADDRGDNK
jgi:hypothetical protein